LTVLYDSVAKKFYRYKDCIVNTTALVSSDMSDWPSHMQDAMWKAIEAHAFADNVNYSIHSVRADTDVDTGPYVHVTIRGEIKTS